jgi:aminoglycoside 6'-N-acetyltransferase I
MGVRPATRQDAAAWAAVRAALWPEADAMQLRAEADAFFLGEIPQTMMAAVFLAEDDSGTLIGMLELSLRPYADGCESSPVPYVEGWYVAPRSRRHGVGAALVKAAEDWAMMQGYSEMASDALLENTVSQQAHKALGFDEVERAIRFRKELKR